MLTSRDYKVIEFLERFKIATTSTIAQVLFNGCKRSCQNRLKVLIQEKKIKRIRPNVNADYIYFIKMPKQRKHSLYISEFYGEYAKTHDVYMFVPEVPLTNIRPDALIITRNGNGYESYFLEVELSNKGLDYKKYEKYYLSGAWKEVGTPVMPKILVLSKNKVTLPNNLNCKYEFVELGKELYI